MKKRIKKSKYCQAAEARRASFTPIIASCKAIFDNEAEVYFKGLLQFCQRNGVQITQKPSVISELECKFASSDQSAYVFEDPELNGEEQGSWIMLLFH